MPVQIDRLVGCHVTAVVCGVPGWRPDRVLIYMSGTLVQYGSGFRVVQGCINLRITREMVVAVGYNVRAECPVIMVQLVSGQTTCNGGG